MNRQFTGNIALGVGSGNLESAAEFFSKHLGMNRGKSTEKWIEMTSGPLSFYLIGDDHGTPTFELNVDEVNAAMDEFTRSGCTEAMLDGSPDERFIRTPFGQFICISPVA